MSGACERCDDLAPDFCSEACEREFRKMCEEKFGRPPPGWVPEEKRLEDEARERTVAWRLKR